MAMRPPGTASRLTTGMVTLNLENKKSFKMN